MEGVVVKILQLLFSLLAAGVALVGDTWHPERSTWRRVTGIGWFAIVCLAAALGLGIADVVLSNKKSEKSGANQERLQKALDASSERFGNLLSESQATSAKLNDAVNTLSQIANAQSDGASRDLAAQTLDDIFKLRRSAVVKVKAWVGGEERVKSGFFLNREGHILTADFAVMNPGSSAPASQITVETVDGVTLPAEFVLVNPELAFAVLKTNPRDGGELDLAAREPKAWERILVIGYTPWDFMTRASGTIAELQDPLGIYLRDRSSLPGFGGGPVLDKDGMVIGVNWGAFEPPVPGRAKFVRADRIRAYLEQLGMPL